MERRFVDSKAARTRVEKREGEKQKIAGYGAVFFDGTEATEFVLWDDQYGRAVERIMPGAFDNALKRPDDVRGLFNHDPSQILGRTTAGTMSLAADKTGLAYEIEPGDTATARDVAAHIERGDVSGSSFAFRIPPGGQKWVSVSSPDGRMMDTREITDVELFDVGPVTYPAYEATTTGLRSAGSVDEARMARDAYLKSAATPRLDAGRLEIAEKLS